MNKLMSFLIMLVMPLILFSCNKNENPGQSTKTIGVSLLTRGHIFYRDLEEGLQDEAAKYGYKFNNYISQLGSGKQISQIEDFISRKVDAIIVSPVDSKGIGSGIGEANKAGIPVFTAI